ncbi:hybrid sensor histidine kinase/response regulator [Hydrogenophaga sp. BPS33]|uniref:hybrid sensor histidine kinase/response regulator n=1 Tax=Hydrogenophaga sp. BPS33 TaxID=2651974 RepID=UPI0013203DA1|nr:ATP-binding protein [Hydrogenophaga sp. BPS33]QHE88150.1 response regulator [Hydrogenophaga sp. BPS33]
MSGTPQTPDKAPVRILHLEDSRVDHALVKFALQRSQLASDMVLVDTLEDFRRELETAPFDAVLADYHLPGFTGMDAWDVVCEMGLRLPFIVLSGAIGEAAAVDAMHRGISDYILKDSMHRLSHVIQRAIEVAQTRRAADAAGAELAESRRRLAELAEHLQTSIEQERADIAREIHDDIGGALASVKLDLALVARRADDASMQSHLGSALEMVQHALDASQRIMMNLRPPILDQGLVAAVDWLAAGFERRTGLRVVVRRSAATIDVPREVQLVAYRTAQEALTNINKHAQASAVDIDLSDGEGVLTLEVSDNGKGLDAHALRKAKSFGLLGLRERAAKVGGWLDVSSSPKGTSVILSVPLQLAQNPDNAAKADEESNDQSDFV